MGLLKKIVRQFVLPMALNVKLDKYFIKKTNKSCCIINFHGVRKQNTGIFNNRHLQVSEFEKMIVYLKANYKIIPLSELFDLHRTKRKIECKTIALTFDDGYLNNFEIAFPILKKHNVPATFYLITKGLLQSDFIVWPDLIDLVKKFDSSDITIEGHKFPSPSYHNDQLGSEVINFLKTKGEMAENLSKEVFTNKAKQQVDNVGEFIKLVDAETIKPYVKESLLEFGSHTHTHYCLEYLNSETLKNELQLSQKIIQDITGQKVVSLAFPDGSYNQETLSKAKDCGYTDLVAVNYKFSENNKNPNLLSRFTISNSTTYESNALRLAKEFDVFGF